MSVKENKIEGDVIISGDITTGGGVVANGDSVFNKDVIIKGKLDASNIRGACKGLFETEDLLKSYYPNPKIGWWALVGTKTPATIYLAGSDGWYTENGTSGGIVVETQGNTDAMDEVKVLQQQITEIDTKLNVEAETREQADNELRDLIENNSGDGSNSSTVALLPFDGIVSKVTVAEGGAPFPDAIVFNNDTKRFIAKSGDSYRTSWPEVNDYGTVDRLGCDPNLGLYLLRSKVNGNNLADAIYKWTGSNMVEITDFPTKTSDLINDSGFITSKDIPVGESNSSGLASSALPFEFTTEVQGGINIYNETYKGTDGNIVYQNGVFYCQVRTKDGIRFYTKYADLSKYGNTATNYCLPENDRLYYDKTSGKIYIGKNQKIIPSFVTKTSELANDSDFAYKSEIATDISQLTGFDNLALKTDTVKFQIQADPLSNTDENTNFLRNPELMTAFENAANNSCPLFLYFSYADAHYVICPAFRYRVDTNGLRTVVFSYILNRKYREIAYSMNPLNDIEGKPVFTIANLAFSGSSQQSPSAPETQSVFSRIGYTAEEVDICHDDELDYSEEVKAKYEIHEISDFSNDNKLVYPPMVDTSAIKDLSRFYFKCGNILTIPKINLSSATKTVEMLAYCYSLRSIPEIDTSGVVDMDSMFYNCTSLVSVPLLATSKVVNMAWMFSSCTSLKTIQAFDCHSATNVSNMFYGCKSLVTTSYLNTKSATNMKKMFADCSSLEKIDGLDFDSVTDMSNIFSGCNKLKYLLIYNIGKSPLEFYNFSEASGWGTDGEMNRYSLIESLVEQSYDRKGNGMSTATIRLSVDTSALLTNNNLSRLADKGYEVVAY